MKIRRHNHFTMMCDVVARDVNSAILVLLKLHRKRIGGKRVLAMISQQPPPSFEFRYDCFCLPGALV